MELMTEHFTKEVRIKKLDNFPEDMELPAYGTKLASGLDVRAVLPDKDSPMLLDPGEVKLVSTGLAMAIPPGFEVQVRPRSGLAFKHGITVNNAPGTIDADYRGELKIMLINHGSDEFQINHGERVAQLVLCPVIQAELKLVDDLDETDRGDGGFGSTGVN